MPVVPARWPIAVTIAWLIAEKSGMGVHCMKSAHHAVFNPASLAFAPETPVPSLAGRFKCGRSGSTDTEARPGFPARKAR